MSLVVEGLGVRYGRTVAVEHCDLEVPAGTAVALLGANGAGKTTVCRAISGIVKVGSGRVSVDGETISGRPPSAIVRRGVVQVPEGRALFPNLTVRDNLRLGGHSVDTATMRRGIDSVFETFPVLRERARSRAAELSGGQQQMLAIGRALVVSPRYLILDELSLGLAPIVIQQLYELLARIAVSGVGVLVVEQSVNLALRNTDRAHVLYRGRAVDAGPSSEFAADAERVWRAYTGGSATAPAAVAGDAT